MLEYSGEKYYLFNPNNRHLELYNVDHTSWKTIILPDVGETQWAVSTIKVYHVSEFQFNSDTNIEVGYSYYSTDDGMPLGIIMSEDGTTLLTINDVNELSYNQISGYSDKLIAIKFNNFDSSSKVYSVPELQLENNYLNGIVKRVLFENSGIKYYVLEYATNNVKLYNEDHSHWKTVHLPIPSGYNLKNVSFVSETQISPENSIVIGYNYTNWSNIGTQGRIVAEDGEVLLTTQDFYSMSMYLSNLEGLESKFIVDASITYNTYKTDIYQLPSLVLEHSFDNSVRRIKLENSGEIYYNSYYDLSNYATVYNGDFSFWKTINYPNCIAKSYVNNLSESIINEDDLLELTISTPFFSEGGGAYTTYIINENGFVYESIGSGMAVNYYSQAPFETTKLIVPLLSTSGGINSYGSKVYGAGSLGNNFFTKTNIILNPIPTSSFLNISSPSAVVEATLYDLIGAKIKKIMDQDITKINVENLPSGIYLLNLMDNNNQKSTHKIIISH
jgi:hypothetical protein